MNGSASKTDTPEPEKVEIPLLLAEGEYTGIIISAEPKLSRVSKFPYIACKIQVDYVYKASGEPYTIFWAANRYNLPQILKHAIGTRYLELTTEELCTILEGMLMRFEVKHHSYASDKLAVDVKWPKYIGHTLHSRGRSILSLIAYSRKELGPLYFSQPHNVQRLMKAKPWWRHLWPFGRKD